MVLLLATIITRRLLTNAWNSWCVVMIIVLIIRVGAQSIEDAEASSDLPAQVLEGMDMSHATYHLNAFDCDKPEDVMTQSIPESCTVETKEESDVDLDSEARQDYTILQKVATFQYAATLCTLCKSRHFYDCVWKSHMRIAAPPQFYLHETLQVHEPLMASNGGVFFDPTSRVQHKLEANQEVNYLQSVVEGSISYDGSHSYCSRKDSQVDGHRIESLLTTESLEFSIRTVTVIEEYDTGDIIIRENGVSIPAAYKQNGGMTTNFGTLVFHRSQPLCQWKKVRDISASRRPRIGVSGMELIDQDRHMHVTLHGPIPEVQGCPAKYLWSSTGEPHIRVVQRTDNGPRREGDFIPLLPQEILFTASMNLKLEHAFYQLRERFQQLSAAQKLSYLDIRTLGNTDKPDTSLQAQYLTFTRGETLYSLGCKKWDVYVSADWDTKACYQELPVWIYLPNNQRKLRFLMSGSRLLLNSSKAENCTQVKIIPQGYQATSGAWTALTPDLQLIPSPLEMVLAKLEEDGLDPESASRAGAYQTEALLRWSEYHHRQF